MEDWDLLARAGKGDEQAFRRLVESHQDRLVRLCQRLLHDREEALDASQTVFLKLYRKAGSLQPRGLLYTWLYRVATNHCLNLLRRRRIVRFLPLVRQRQGREEQPMEVADRAPDPLASLESKRRWKATQASIGKLPEGQRMVLVLAKFEGLSYRDIAATLGITEGAVESRLFRAMRNLMKAQESRPPSVAGKGEAK